MVRSGARLMVGRLDVWWCRACACARVCVTGVMREGPQGRGGATVGKFRQALNRCEECERRGQIQRAHKHRPQQPDESRNRPLHTVRWSAWAALPEPEPLTRSSAVTAVSTVDRRMQMPQRRPSAPQLHSARCTRRACGSLTRAASHVGMCCHASGCVLGACRTLYVVLAHRRSDHFLHSGTRVAYLVERVACKRDRPHRYRRAAAVAGSSRTHVGRSSRCIHTELRQCSSV